MTVILMRALHKCCNRELFW